MRPAAALVLVAGLLSACSTLTPPRPAPAPLLLEVRALDQAHARLTLAPAPARARWEVQPSQLCGGEDGPPTASGEWPAPAPSLVLEAGPGDLVTVWAEVDGVSLSAADCPA